MLAGSEAKATRWILLGLILGGFAHHFLKPPDGEEAEVLLGLAFGAASAAVSVFGCSKYARGKGQEPAWGLFGIIGLAGLLVLLFLEDNYKCCKVFGETCTHGGVKEKPEDWSSRAA
jgi:hypothetical protein